MFFARANSVLDEPCGASGTTFQQAAWRVSVHRPTLLGQFQGQPSMDPDPRWPPEGAAGADQRVASPWDDTRDGQLAVLTMASQT